VQFPGLVSVHIRSEIGGILCRITRPGNQVVAYAAQIVQFLALRSRAQHMHYQALYLLVWAFILLKDDKVKAKIPCRSAWRHDTTLPEAPCPPAPVGFRKPPGAAWAAESEINIQAHAITPSGQPNLAVRLPSIVSLFDFNIRGPSATPGRGFNPLSFRA
jgi:hypothetical protein